MALTLWGSGGDQSSERAGNLQEATQPGVQGWVATLVWKGPGSLVKASPTATPALRQRLGSRELPFPHG